MQTRDLKENSTNFNNIPKHPTFYLLCVGIAATCIATSPIAMAGPYQTFGPYYAWINNFNDPNNGIQQDNAAKAPNLSSDEAYLAFDFNFQKSSLYGYPAIIRGSHYGWNPTNDTLFPRKFTEFKSIPVKFSYQAKGANIAGDFAYDMFFRQDSTGKVPQLEVMIWGDHNSWPLGSLLANDVITQNNVHYDLWGGYNSGAGYYTYTFVPTNTVGKGASLDNVTGTLDLDVKPFLTWLAAHNSASNGAFNSSLYLDVVEVGFEVVNGKGNIQLRGQIHAY